MAFIIERYPCEEAGVAFFTKNSYRRQKQAAWLSPRHKRKIMATESYSGKEELICPYCPFYQKPEKGSTIEDLYEIFESGKCGGFSHLYSTGKSCLKNIPPHGPIAITVEVPATLFLSWPERLFMLKNVIQGDITFTPLNYPNVGDYGCICWGSVHKGTANADKSIRHKWNTFWTSTFNNDLGYHAQHRYQSKALCLNSLSFREIQDYRESYSLPLEDFRFNLDRPFGIGCINKEKDLEEIPTEYKVESEVYCWVYLADKPGWYWVEVFCDDKPSLWFKKKGLATGKLRPLDNPPITRTKQIPWSKIEPELVAEQLTLV
jgi:hypothetical protein